MISVTASSDSLSSISCSGSFSSYRRLSLRSNNEDSETQDAEEGFLTIESCSSSTSPVSKLPRRPSYPFQSKRGKHFLLGWATRCLLLIFTLLVFMSYIVFPVEEDLTCPEQPTWNYPSCSAADNSLPQIPTPEYWLSLREAYHNAVDEEQFSLHPTSWKNGSDTGFHVPIELQYSPQRGRGLYATEDIPKETLLWDNRYTARIKNECSARQFVHTLTEQQACDVILWGYPYDHGAGMEWAMELDPCCLINKADTRDQVNVYEKVINERNPLQPGAHTMWSSRYIHAGEELLHSYDDLRKSDPRKNIFWQFKMVVKSWGFVFLY